MFLFYRDSLDCVEYLLGNPLFADCMDFSPVRLYQDAEQTICVYTEWLTGNTAWEMQVSLFSVLPSWRSNRCYSRFSQTAPPSSG